jgi:hypothetical protein
MNTAEKTRTNMPRHAIRGLSVPAELLLLELVSAVGATVAEPVVFDSPVARSMS